MISVYDSLTEIREHVSNHKSLSKEIKDEKIQEISKMEDMLKTTSKEPSIRLAEVKAHGLSDQCKNVLLKNSDNFLVSFFKTLFSKLFNIKTKMKLWFHHSNKGCKISRVQSPSLRLWRLQKMKHL